MTAPSTAAISRLERLPWSPRNTYNDCVLKVSFLAVPAQVMAAHFIETFNEFPPRQTPSSFSVDQIMETLKRPQSG